MMNVKLKYIGKLEQLYHTYEEFSWLVSVVDLECPLMWLDVCHVIYLSCSVSRPGVQYGIAPPNVDWLTSTITHLFIDGIHQY